MPTDKPLPNSSILLYLGGVWPSTTTLQRLHTANSQYKTVPQLHPIWTSQVIWKWHCHLANGSGCSTGDLGDHQYKIPASQSSCWYPGSQIDATFVLPTPLLQFQWGDYVVHSRSHMVCAQLTLCFIARITDSHFCEKLLWKYHKPPTTDLDYPLPFNAFNASLYMFVFGGRTRSDLH